jgi:A/G-specific adenine glycosylase
MAQWAGLGYYARARNLHAAAKRCVELHDGDLPRDFDALHAPARHRPQHRRCDPQPGLERPVRDPRWQRQARAQPLPRHRRLPGPAGHREAVVAIAEAHVAQVPAGRMADYTQAQMDLGATVCSRASPPA